MQPLNADQIRGNWATLLLPIDADESIDFGRLDAELEALIAAGPDGIYSGGTAGEFEAMTEPEFDRVNGLLAVRCEDAGIPFQIGASHTSPHVSLARVRRAVALRPAAIQVVLADWFPLTNAEAADCLNRFGEAADGIGLVLYNPPHGKRVLEPADFGRLSENVPALVGIKVADGDEAWYSAMRQHAAGLSLFVPGHHLATGIRLGAHGSYSNVACLSPAGAQRWYRRMQSDSAGALATEGRIRTCLDRHIQPLIADGYCNAAVDKLLAAIGAWAPIGTRLRWPYRWIESDVAERLRPAAREEVPEMFD